MGFGALLFVGLTACKAERPGATAAAEAGSARTSTTPAQPPGAARFLEIRRLLGQDVEGPERSTRLFSVVRPVCEDPLERQRFLDAWRWSASFSVGYERLSIVLGLDTVEHVVMACFRLDPKEGHALLDAAEAAVPDPSRYALIRARLLGAEGRLPEALASAEAARSRGSVHALALSANLEAQLARARGAGYEPGMLDKAIGIVSAEPDAAWQLIDLSAVLSTRAHLLLERSIWEEGDPALRSMDAAAQVFVRLSVPPFIDTMRSQSADQACLLAGIRGAADQGREAGRSPAKETCRRAAEEGRHLGALLTSAGAEDAARFDLARLEKLRGLARALNGLPSGAWLLFTYRGDEAELLVWVRPMAHLLGHLAPRAPRILLVDRTKNPRARAMALRPFALAGLPPAEVVPAEDTLAMPCVAALLAQRQRPKSCPIAPALARKLEAAGRPAVSFLVGRDLDAELDDLALYDISSALASLRRPRLEKGLLVELKSVSDVFVLAPAEGAR